MTVFARSLPHHFDGNEFGAERIADLEEDLTVLAEDLAAAIAAINGQTSGAQGPIGLVGPQGPDGDDGQDGVQGIAGAVGATGAQGLSIPGLDGEDGLDSVIPGQQGPVGAVGPMGLSGSDGDDGGDGIPGPVGATGATGATGSAGPQGPAGTGAPGQDGDDGDAGSFLPSTPRILGTLYTDGTNAYFVSGKVGVGTTAPAATFDVNGTVRIGTGTGIGSLNPIEIVNTADSGVTITSTDATGASEVYTAFFLKDSAAVIQKVGAIAVQWTDNTAANGYASWNEHATYIVAGAGIDQFGLVHWGNNGVAFFPTALTAAKAPGAGIVKLYGNSATNGRFQIESSDASRSMVFGLVGGIGYISTESATALTFLTGGIEAMRIDTAGKVGIGTTTPVSPLQVNGLVNIKNYTVATLPAATRGDIAYVTDALAPAFLAVIVGGGAVVTPVFYNGANWVGF